MSIKTWAVGERVTAAKLNTIRDELNRPICKLVQQSAQSIPNNTDTALTFGTGSEAIDTHGFHSETTNNTRITPNVAGYYRITGTVFWASNTAPIVNATIAKNGTVQTPRGRHRPDAAVAGQNSVLVSILLEANGSTDYFELMATQNSGGALNTNVGGSFASVFDVVFERSL